MQQEGDHLGCHPVQRKPWERRLEESTSPPTYGHQGLVWTALRGQILENPKRPQSWVVREQRLFRSSTYRLNEYDKTQLQRQKICHPSWSGETKIHTRAIQCFINDLDSTVTLNYASAIKDISKTKILEVRHTCPRASDKISITRTASEQWQPGPQPAWQQFAGSKSFTSCCDRITFVSSKEIFSVMESKRSKSLFLTEDSSFRWSMQPREGRAFN